MLYHIMFFYIQKLHVYGLYNTEQDKGQNVENAEGTRTLLLYPPTPALETILYSICLILYSTYNTACSHVCVYLLYLSFSMWKGVGGYG